MNEFFSETQTELFGTDGTDLGGRSIAETLADTTPSEAVTFIRDFDEAGELISFDAYDTMGRRLGSLPEREATRAAEYLKENPEMEICGEVLTASGGSFPSCTVRIWAQRVSNVTYTAPATDYDSGKKGSSPLVFLIPIIIIVVLIGAVGVAFFSGVLSMFGDVKEQLPEMPEMPSLNVGFAEDDDSVFVDDVLSEEQSSETTSSEEEKEPEPPIKAEELAVTLKTEEDSRLGVTYVSATVKNNSAYPLTTLTFYVNYGGESLVLISTDTTLSGESTGKLESFVMQTGVSGSPTLAKFSATAKNGADSIYVKYDYKLKEYQVY